MKSKYCYLTKHTLVNTNKDTAIFIPFAPPCIMVYVLSAIKIQGYCLLFTNDPNQKNLISGC